VLLAINSDGAVEPTPATLWLSGGRFGTASEIRAAASPGPRQRRLRVRVGAPIPSEGRNRPPSTASRVLRPGRGASSSPDSRIVAGDRRPLLASVTYEDLAPRGASHRSQAAAVGNRNPKALAKRPRSPAATSRLSPSTSRGPCRGNSRGSPATIGSADLLLFPGQPTSATAPEPTRVRECTLVKLHYPTFSAQSNTSWH
jgi:hypothetical protein